jgi:osmotically inducible protein OsmC
MFVLKLALKNRSSDVVFLPRFSMALAAGLSAAGHTPERIRTVATVHIEQQDGGFAIPCILLETEAPGARD